MLGSDAGARGAACAEHPRAYCRALERRRRRADEGGFDRATRKRKKIDLGQGTPAVIDDRRIGCVMGGETELKFEVPPQELRSLKSQRALYRKRPAELNLVSVYFDTPKHKLARKGVSLRVRRNGKRR